MHNAKRVLIVEDEEALLFGLKKLLETETIVISIARSLKEAETLMHQIRYQAVITDLRLSDAEMIEGYEVVATARKLYPQCKIVVITANADNGPRYRTAEQMVDYFLPKPVPTPRIREILNAL
ncbi:MAG: hypothetical protein A2293_08725 [Elusimicrobia bacterium RIFOXYB2_FULL_49_7]|nr:MAG: hypothetical protein A2293_08725 [Elusimicrobia bacterium RIFOXYB2_FULL_49_7]